MFKISLRAEVVTYPRRNVTMVCGASYHIFGSCIYLQDTKIRFRLQVESYISDWLFSELRLLASYVSRHKAMAYDRLNKTVPFLQSTNSEMTRSTFLGGGGVAEHFALGAGQLGQQKIAALTLLYLGCALVP